jgi:hypothetical protein
LGWGKWWSLTKRIVSIEVDKLGVYELVNYFHYPVYYGSGKIKTSLLNHIIKKEFPMAVDYRYELFNTEIKCKERVKALLEEFQKAHDKLPIYNKKILHQIN